MFFTEVMKESVPMLHQVRHEDYINNDDDNEKEHSDGMYNYWGNLPEPFPQFILTYLHTPS